MLTFNNMLNRMTYLKVVLQHNGQGEQTSRFVDMSVATRVEVSQQPKQNRSDPISIQ
jgi:hypothetical protein